MDNDQEKLNAIALTQLTIFPLPDFWNYIGNLAPLLQ